LLLGSLSSWAQQKLPASPVEEVGVYHEQSSEWVEMMPEVVNWKTGGAVKSLATAGIVKGDVNGHLKGSSSRTPLSLPARLLVYCPEGTAITEYQLIRMHEHAKAREFRTVTGGIFHVSGGAMRDTLEFGSAHIAKRTYTIDLTALPAGEYGLLSPGASMASSASAQLGKMYTFSIGSQNGVSQNTAQTAKKGWSQRGILANAEPF
jgi:hypothetical protein